MTDFDSLLPPRTAPPRLPSRGGPAAVVDAARSRRRRKATKVVGTGGALSVVFLGMAVLRAPAPLHTIEEGPATQAPTVSWTSTAPVSPPPATVAPVPGSPGDEPGTVEGGTAPSAGTRSVGPTTAPSTLLPSDPALPAPDPPPTLRYVRVLREEVADRPAEDCLFHTSTRDADTVLCTRQFGPTRVPSGTPVDFGYEVCAKTQDVTLHAPGQEEYEYRIMTESTPGGRVVWTARERPTGLGAHSYDIKAGQCVRYTFQWDGRGDSGRPLAVGDYHVDADIPGDWNVKQGAADTSVRFEVT